MCTQNVRPGHRMCAARRGRLGDRLRAPWRDRLRRVHPPVPARRSRPRRTITSRCHQRNVSGDGRGRLHEMVVCHGSPAQTHPIPPHSDVSVTHHTVSCPHLTAQRSGRAASGGGPRPHSRRAPRLPCGHPRETIRKSSLRKSTGRRPAGPWMAFREVITPAPNTPSPVRKRHPGAPPAYSTVSRKTGDTVTYGFASSTRLNGVSAARRNRVKPPAVATSRRRASPAWAPRAAPTSCEREFGTHIIVDPA